MALQLFPAKAVAPRLLQLIEAGSISQGSIIAAEVSLRQLRPRQNKKTNHLAVRV